jgi:hypothetical protein
MTPDARLHDAVALEEIELYGELVIAASAHDGPMSTAEIDAALGLVPAGGHGQPNRPEM